MPDDPKANLKHLAEKLKAAAEKVKKLKEHAESADKSMDAVEVENK